MEGTGVERDPAKGLRWYLRAAENDPEGNTAAKVLIGKAYADGQGTEVDYVTAAKWFLRSTNDKHVGWSEHIYLTVMFETGLGLRDPLIFCFSIDTQLIEHVYRSKFLTMLPPVNGGV